MTNTDHRGMNTECRGINTKHRVTNTEKRGTNIEHRVTLIGHYTKSYIQRNMVCRVTHIEDTVTASDIH